MSDFRDVFELKNQQILHSDCETAAKEALEYLNIKFSERTTRTTLSESDKDELDSPSEDEEKFDFGYNSDANSMPLPSITQLTSDFESVLTHFVQTYHLDYNHTDGWVSVLKVLYCTLEPLDKQDLYAFFASVYHRFIPNGPNVAERMCHILRLLFQYHEPELCNLLESHKITPDLFAQSWLFSLFTNAVSHATVLALWDVYFLMADPLLGLYIVLVLLINAKPSLMESGQSVNYVTDEASNSTDGVVNKENKIYDRGIILQALIDLPKPMEENDVTSLIELTQLFTDRTPTSFRTEFLPILFGNTILDVDDGQSVLSTAPLCLPVTVQEVLEAQKCALQFSQAGAQGGPDGFQQPIRFLLVDCRPADQYNAGHLNTAFFVDSQLILSEPDSFQTTVEALLQSQQRALNAGSHAAGEHITFLSSGRTEEDKIANMVVSAFLRLHTPYVSFIKGGFAALHEALGPQEMDRCLVSHNPKECLVCRGLPSKNKTGNVSLEQRPGTVKLNTPVNQPRAILPSSRNPVGGFLTKLSGKLLKTVEAVRSAKPQIGVESSPPGLTPNAIGIVEKLPVKIQPIHTNARSIAPVKNISQVVSDRPKSYRNTSSVFSIDDEEDADDEFIPQPNDSSLVKEPGDNATNMSELSPGIGETESKSRSWIQRITGVMHTSDTEDLPAGDIPQRSGGLDTSEPGDLIDTACWSSRPEVHGVFDCQFINTQGRESDGYLVLVERHLLILRDRISHSPVRLLASIGSAVQSAFGRTSGSETNPTRSTVRSRHAIVLRSAPLALITRITSNRRLPECITFHYSSTEPIHLLQLNAPVMGIRDRLYIPQAGEAVRMIKLAIYNVTMA